jgi:hypothetical protein
MQLLVRVTQHISECGFTRDQGEAVWITTHANAVSEFTGKLETQYFL